MVSVSNTSTFFFTSLAYLKLLSRNLITCSVDLVERCFINPRPDAQDTIEARCRMMLYRRTDAKMCCAQRTNGRKRELLREVDEGGSNPACMAFSHVFLLSVLPLPSNTSNAIRCVRSEIQAQNRKLYRVNLSLHNLTFILWSFSTETTILRLFHHIMER